MTRPLTIIPILGVPEVRSGDNVAALMLAALDGTRLAPGDVVVVSSKIVSKALGLSAIGSDKSELVLGESVRVVAERSTGDHVTRVVEAVAGPVMAAAGIDASNTGPSERLLLLPHDPDACARSVRSDLLSLSGMPSSSPLAVILSDTAGRPWRAGLTDFALGAAGLRVLLDHRGEGDADGRLMSVTARAVADEIAAAADLVKGKADGVAAAVIRGLPESWFEDQDDEFSSGARGLVRTGPGDWFALGHVEALRQALGVTPGSPHSEAVGIRSVEAEAFADRVARVVSLTLFADEDASLDLEIDGTVDGPDGVAVVTLGATDDFALGRLTQRLEIAAASEDLQAHLTGAPTAEHSITATLSGGP